MKLSKLVFGVGVNDADYRTSIRAEIGGKVTKLWVCQFYRTWAGMLTRCYSPKEHARRPNYIGCSVAPEWRSFMTFREWMEIQPWEGNQLDKDILIPGNKVYGPNTCVFIPQGLNSFLNEQHRKRGLLPVGVSVDKRRNKYQAKCCNPFTGKQETIGLFVSAQEAHQAWLSKKHEHAMAYAEMQTDDRIANALRTRYLKQTSMRTTG